jgi:hypothetical protein
MRAMAKPTPMDYLFRAQNNTFRLVRFSVNFKATAFAAAHWKVGRAA